jgi:hypothetical protein
MHASTRQSQFRHRPQKHEPTTHLQVPTGRCRKPLLDFAHLKQLVPTHDPAQLAYEGDVLTNVPAELAELGVLFYETLHIRDGIDGGRRKVTGLIRLHVCFKRRAQVTKGAEVLRGEEGVCLQCEGYFLW